MQQLQKQSFKRVHPPVVEGYKWYYRNRVNKNGGGVGILVRNDIAKSVQEVKDFADNDHEILWIQVKAGKSNTYFGTYYGKQENEKKEMVEEEMSSIATQINNLKQKGKVVLSGDFNAKLKVTKSTPNICQDESRNGQILKEMMYQTCMTAKSLEANDGNWTRVHRKNSSEKSIIDYILINKQNAHDITDLVIDEEGTHRIKGREETDHNTVTFKLKTETDNKVNYRKIWKINNIEGWKEYNRLISKEISDNPNKPTTQIITETLEKTIGSTIITEGEYKVKDNEDIKMKRAIKRTKEKQFNYALRHQRDKIKETKEEYIKSQTELRAAIAENQKQITESKLKKLIEEGGVKSHSFWKIRKRILRRNEDEYDTIDEDGYVIKDPEEAKKHIANYFENLYQAREGTEEYQKWTDIITKHMHEIEEKAILDTEQDEITIKELNCAIKSLRKGKTCGPDNIPNEVFLMANETTKKAYLKDMNQVLKEGIPEEWQEGDIKRLYKGKGTKGKCSTERGITLASNYGKVFERIMNNRALKDVYISAAQAGGKKGKATVDHLMILKDVVNTNRKRNKPVYVVFLDVTKAYDKAWLDAIMYVMHKQGIKGKLWSTIRKLNQNLKARIQTKDGPTRPITIKDSIRQGGVLSVLQYAVLMDEISKEIHKQELGLSLNPSWKKIGCLLWMDDVALIHNDPDELQKMLDITNEIANRYRIVFGEEKSKVMIIGGYKEQEPELKLGEMTLKKTETYKYLGEMLNEKFNMKNQISETKRKVEGAYQTVVALSGDDNYNGIEMETMWKLVDTCIKPIILYGAETWKMPKTDKEEYNRILDNIIKRILKVPVTTPREVLYMETGLLDIETSAHKSRITMANRLTTTDDEFVKEAMVSSHSNSWIQETQRICKEYNISEDDIKMKKSILKKKVEDNVKTVFKDRITKNGMAKSKVNYLTQNGTEWEPGKMREYMKKMNRNQVSTIFKARTRMLDVKNNFRNKYKDLKCRGCGIEDETQEHVLSLCPVTTEAGTITAQNHEIFSENNNTLKTTAGKIGKIMEKIQKQDVSPQSVSMPTTGDVTPVGDTHSVKLGPCLGGEDQ